MKLETSNQVSLLILMQVLTDIPSFKWSLTAVWTPSIAAATTFAQSFSPTGDVEGGI